MHVFLQILLIIVAIRYLTIFINGLIILSWFVLRGLIYLEATFYFFIINPGLKVTIIIWVLNSSHGEESLFVWSEFIV